MRTPNKLRTAFFSPIFRLATFSLFLTSVVFFSGAAQAAPLITDNDAIALLSMSLGGWDLASVAWAGMNPSEKQSVRDQAAQIASMAEAGKRDGIDADLKVELALKWGTNNLLAEAWKDKIVATTDLSEQAVRDFYAANIARYRSTGAVRYRRELQPQKQKKTAGRRQKKSSSDRLKNAAAVNWVAYEKLDPALGKALREAPLNKVTGPLKTSEGYILFEVLERRDGGPMPLEKCADLVREDMIRTAIKSRLP